ncbi:penicillin-binding protein 1C [Aquimarina agarivorans]|uniref:penicillin-binding protein 1C n=1 Tax=Aquimarina agarivorans TaxID=980584 RepID=UPI00031425F7|nr:penicillin-binding protein 1C [Aquimarina agarivorans]
MQKIRPLFTKKYLLFISVVFFILYYFSLPKQLFKTPISTVVEAIDGQLIGAVIADDGQWRFPELDTVPNKFKQCIVVFEDAYFYKHFGFNPVSIVKAIRQNRKAKKNVRGGSTITQQVIRLARKLKKRTYSEKIVELILATRLEFKYSKDKILSLYASHAPFGGNVVGLEMAAWRYFGLAPNQLSWAETATLAVLPNAPALIYPGKNQGKLKAKRDRLLQKLYKKSVIDSITYVLALEEVLPQKPHQLPVLAPHFTQELIKKHKGKRIHSSLDFHLQEKVNSIAERHYNRLKQNEVHNLSVLVLDVQAKKVLSYVGNAPTDVKHQKHVDNVMSPRSTGSTLKPFLYAHMLQSGTLLPTQLVKDIPTYIAGYVPENFSLSYDGAVPANDALTRSLNIPAVRMLQEYGLEKFRQNLSDYKVKHIDKLASHYGLSLILGGGEITLWDLCRLMLGYAGTVNHFDQFGKHYMSKEFEAPSYFQDKKLDLGVPKKQSEIIDVAAAFLTLDALTNVNRPQIDQAWRYYDSSQKIAWKTGTSFGNKDAWAVGTTPKYVVGVWVGNSDGEGRPNITGLNSAAPLMFDVFDALPTSDWFVEPSMGLREEAVCSTSGHLALPICPSIIMKIPENGLRNTPCPYHEEVWLDKGRQFRVNSNCESISEMKKEIWFVLPPLVAHYYQQKNSEYRKLPDFKAGCLNSIHNTIEFLYPIKFETKISLTKGTNGIQNPLVIKATHANPEANLYWYLDNEYLKSTSGIHEISIAPNIGKHVLTAIDDFGNEGKRIVVIY